MSELTNTAKLIASDNPKTAYFLLYGIVQQVARINTQIEGLMSVRKEQGYISTKQLDYLKSLIVTRKMFDGCADIIDAIECWEEIAASLESDDNFTLPLNMKSLEAYIGENAEEKARERTKEADQLFSSIDLDSHIITRPV